MQGGCIGGGLDLALACDIRVCSADAFFTVKEVHIGMAADVGSLTGEFAALSATPSARAAHKRSRARGGVTKRGRPRRART